MARVIARYLGADSTLAPEIQLTLPTDTAPHPTQLLPGAPEELGSFVGLKTVPSTDPFPREAWGKRACALISCYNGSAEDGAKALAPVLTTLQAAK